MEKPRISGKIIKAMPGSVYEDRVYDQYVVFELPDGLAILLFDYRMIVKKDMVGKAKTVTISAFIPRIEKCVKERFGTESSARSIDDLMRCTTFIFYGRIAGITDRLNSLYVDIGEGVIEADVHRYQSEGLKTGDFIKIQAGRIDLDAVYDE